MSVSIVTSHGTFLIQLFYRECPKTCRNFVELSKSGYYDGVLIHRLIPDYMAQTGDPYGDGTGGESIYGPTFEDEILGRLSHDVKGIVAMANAGRNTNSSQFFITFRPCPHLDGKHTVFGKVVEGIHVIDDIQMLKTDKKQKPLKPVTIFSATVVEDPWKGEKLPSDCSIPEKPLVKKKTTAKKVKEQCLLQ
jgi:cyclophilin family peptidyl-prolyl cis-trans isomerase